MLIEKNNDRKRVVIVGGGFGGIEVAKKLRKAPVDVLMIDRHNYHTFQPLLYQVATGAIEAETIAFPIRKIFQKQDNFTFLLAEVLKVNAEANTVQTNVGEVAYDFLVIATGAATNFFGNKQLEHFAMGMKTVPEALNLRSMIFESLEAANIEKDSGEKEELMTFVIVGGGPTGVELAGALAELKKHILSKDFPGLDEDCMRVFMVESKPKLLGGMSDEASSKAKEFLEQMKVTIYNGVRVSSFDGELLTINNGTTIRTRNVLWAAGVVGEVPEGIAAPAIVSGNRIETDNINKVKGYDNIFAIGDVCNFTDADNVKGLPGVAQVAIQQGKHLGKNIIALLKGEPTIPFTYNDKGSMATIGKNKAVADIGKMRLSGFIAWCLWCFIHLWSLVGFTNRLIVFLNWLGKYFSYNTSTRLILRPFNREIMAEDPKAK